MPLFLISHPLDRTAGEVAGWETTRLGRSCARYDGYDKGTDAVDLETAGVILSKRGPG